MVTRTKTVTLCAVCADEDIERDATLTEDVTVGRVHRRIEVCDEHRVQFTALLVFLERYGEEPAGVGAQSYGCNFCEGTFPTRQAVTRHVRQDHRGYGQLRSAEKIGVDVG